MTHKSGNAKGRRLQVLIAETVAVACGLTIEAASPTKPGKRANGACYVPEGQQPDLRVRQMGQPGADVALLSQKARDAVSLPGREPIWFEAKNTESWALDAAFWRAHDLPAPALKAIQQAYRASNADAGQWTPVVVLSKNHHEPMALWQANDQELHAFKQRGVVLLTGPGWAMCRFDRFINAVAGWRSDLSHQEAA